MSQAIICSTKTIFPAQKCGNKKQKKRIKSPSIQTSKHNIGFFNRFIEKCHIWVRWTCAICMQICAFTRLCGLENLFTQINDMCCSMRNSVKCKLLLHSKLYRESRVHLILHQWNSTASSFLVYALKTALFAFIWLNLCCFAMCGIQIVAVLKYGLESSWKQISNVSNEVYNVWCDGSTMQSNTTAPELVSVYVLLPTSRTIHFNVISTSTIKQIKQKVYDVTGYCAESQRLYQLNKKILLNQTAVQSVSSESELFIELKLRIKGGVRRKKKKNDKNKASACNPGDIANEDEDSDYITPELITSKTYKRGYKKRNSTCNKKVLTNANETSTHAPRNKEVQESSNTAVESNVANDSTYGNGYVNAVKADQQTKRAKDSAQPNRLTYPYTIGHLCKQFAALNINHNHFVDCIDALNHLIMSYCLKTIKKKRKNKKKRPPKLKNVVVLEEDAKNGIHLHAHGLLESNEKISMRSKSYLNIPRSYIIDWLNKNYEILCRAEKQFDDFDYEIETSADVDYDRHNFRIFHGSQAKVHDHYLFIHLETSNDWIKYPAGWLWYIFKTYNYAVRNMVEAQRASIYGSTEEQIQKRVEDYVKKRFGQHVVPKKGSMKDIAQRLLDCQTDEELEAAIKKVEYSADGYIILYKTTGWRELKEMNRERIKDIQQKENNKKRKNTPLLTKEWHESDFNYGKFVQRKSRLPDIYNSISNFIKFFIQCKEYSSKWKCLIIECPKIGQGKSMLLKILKKVYNGYAIRLDRGWQAGAYSNNCDFFWIDSASHKHFGPDGIAYQALEAIAGGQETLLSKRSKAPVKTHCQPIIITTQFKLRNLGYFRELRNAGPDEEVPWRMLMARSTYIRLKASKRLEESLVPFCFYLQKHWKIKDAWGGKTISKAEAGLKNVIDSDDEEMKLFDDREHPGEYWDEGDEQLHEGINYVSIFNKIKDKTLIWYKGMDAQTRDDDVVALPSQQINAMNKDLMVEDLVGVEPMQKLKGLIIAKQLQQRWKGDGYGVDDLAHKLQKCSFATQNIYACLFIAMQAIHCTVKKYCIRQVAKHPANMDFRDSAKKIMVQTNFDIPEERVYVMLRNVVIIKAKYKPKIFSSITRIRFEANQAIPNAIVRGAKPYCWLISCLQILSSVRWPGQVLYGDLASEFEAIEFLSQSEGKFISKNCIAELAQKFVTFLNETTNMPEWDIGRQQNVVDAVIFILQYTQKTQGIIDDIFAFTMKDHFECPVDVGCMRRELSWEANDAFGQTMLTLAIPQSRHVCELQSLYEEYMSFEQIPDYQCNQCNKKHLLQRRFKLTQTSEYLLIELKRVLYIGSSQQAVHTKVMFNFGLVCVVNQEYIAYDVIGSVDYLDGMHFVTNKYQCGRWWRIDDENVQPLRKWDRANNYLLLLQRATGERQKEIMHHYKTKWEDEVQPKGIEPVATTSSVFTNSQLISLILFFSVDNCFEDVKKWTRVNSHFYKAYHIMVVKHVSVNTYYAAQGVTNVKDSENVNECIQIYTHWRNLSRLFLYEIRHLEAPHQRDPILSISIFKSLTNKEIAGYVQLLMDEGISRQKILFEMCKLFNAESSTIIAQRNVLECYDQNVQKK